MEVRGFLTPHEVLRICAEEKLRLMGYRIVPREEASEHIRRVGSPDIIAVRDGEYLIVEVKPSDQLRRYSSAGVKLVLVIDVEEGRAVEVWGLRELEKGVNI